LNPNCPERNEGQFWVQKSRHLVLQPGTGAFEYKTGSSYFGT
jgi:hypothetical protein